MNAAHAALESEVVELLEGTYGCEVCRPTYHETLPGSFSSKLSRCYTPAAMEMRLEPDILAIVPGANKTIRVEVKAPPSRPDLALPHLQVEALQHVFNIRAPDERMYAVRIEGRDVGWSCGDFRQDWIKEIRIPICVRRGLEVFDRAEHAEADDGLDYYIGILSGTFPDAAIRFANEDTPCRGSGDPWITFHHDALEDLPNWREVVHQLCARDAGRRASLVTRTHQGTTP